MAIKGNPHENTRLAAFMERRILELSPRKSQRDIALEAGFRNVNMLSMLKSGNTKLALDRVPALAKALETDPRHLFLLALEQAGLKTTLAAVNDVFGTIVSRNEVAWLEEIRDASGHTDPNLTSRTRSALRAIFGK
jgi:hypothetical protein